MDTRAGFSTSIMAIGILLGAGCDSMPPDLASKHAALLSGTSQELFMPAYYVDADQQQQILAYAQDNLATDVTLVANFGTPGGPGSAPLESCSPNCPNQTWIRGLQAAGVTVLGYVDDPVGASGQGLTDQVDEWVNWYNVDGIMFDDAERNAPDNTDDDVARSGFLATYVAGKINSPRAEYGHLVAFNWGQTGNLQRYVYCALAVYGGWQNTIFSTFEGPESAFNSASFPIWVSSYQSGSFYMLAYSTAGVSTVYNDMQRARQFNAGRVFLTNDTGWKHIPGWADESPYDVYGMEEGVWQSQYSDMDSGTFTDNHDATDPDNTWMSFTCPAAQLCPGGGTNC